MAKQYGILGQRAPELRFDYFINEQGELLKKPVRLSDFSGSLKILFCFQAWCPSCHSKGFPSLQQQLEDFDDEIQTNKLAIIAIQTAFEGRHENNKDTLVDMQNKYNTRIIFGHDDATPRPSTMIDYRTGGTPWFVVIDKNNQVIFNDFHLKNYDNIKSLIMDALNDKHQIPESIIYPVKDNPAMNRYEVTLNSNDIAIVTYRKKDNVLYIDHTEVPSALRGQQYGAVMMESVLEKIEQQGFKIKPICSYAVHYLSKFQRWAHLKA